MIDAKHVHKLLECKYDFKHWIKDVISSFNFKDGIDYISYRYDNNGEQIIDNNSHVFRHDYYLFPKSILCIIYMKCDRSLFKDFIYDIFDCCNIKNDDRVLDIIHRSIDRYNKKCIKYFTYIIRNNNNGFYKAVKKMVNVDGSKRIWKQPEIKDIFEKCGAKKPDKATWGDVQYVFAMYYSDGFPKVFKCENELVKATLMYLDDPDAPEGVAFIRWLAVQDYLGEKINWKDLT